MIYHVVASGVQQSASGMHTHISTCFSILFHMPITEDWVEFPALCSRSSSVLDVRYSSRRRFDPWIGKTLGGGHGNPLQYSCLDSGGWRATVRRVTKSGCDRSDSAHTDRYTPSSVPVCLFAAIPWTKSLFSTPLTLLLFCK